MAQCTRVTAPVTQVGKAEFATSGAGFECNRGYLVTPGSRTPASWWAKTSAPRRRDVEVTWRIRMGAMTAGSARRGEAGCDHDMLGEKVLVAQVGEVWDTPQCVDSTSCRRHLFGSDLQSRRVRVHSASRSAVTRSHRCCAVRSLPSRAMAGT